MEFAYGVLNLDILKYKVSLQNYNRGTENGKDERQTCESRNPKKVEKCPTNEFDPLKWEFRSKLLEIFYIIQVKKKTI